MGNSKMTKLKALNSKHKTNIKSKIQKVLNFKHLNFRFIPPDAGIPPKAVI